MMGTELLEEGKVGNIKSVGKVATGAQRGRERAPLADGSEVYAPPLLPFLAGLIHRMKSCSV